VGAQGGAQLSAVELVLQVDQFHLQARDQHSAVFRENVRAAAQRDLERVTRIMRKEADEEVTACKAQDQAMQENLLQKIAALEMENQRLRDAVCAAKRECAVYRRMRYEATYVFLTLAYHFLS
jgi:hypothetical protein